MPGARLDSKSMAQRAAQEVTAGEAVAIGSGLPTAIPSTLPADTGVGVLWEHGAVGYRTRCGGIM
ncbi:MAG: hypothetical protein F4X27_18755, partial [Chloroflexi bacterium]|nr:hypothetical protein [Chloroflexota bacterium]